MSFQQMQKYEKGRNRIGASRLQQIADALNVTPDAFFDGESSPIATSGSRQIATFEEFISSRDGLALSKAFTNIRDAKIRRSIVSLVKQIAEVV